MKYKVKCVSKPDEMGRRKCLGCGRAEQECDDRTCGLGTVHVGEPTAFTRRGENTAAKRRQHKKGDEAPRRRDEMERYDED